MPRSIQEIAAALDSLTPRDFDYPDGWLRLQQLCDEMQALNAPAACVPLLFSAMERLDDGDADLGTPGPLVHTLESWRGAYESSLAQSVRRKTTPLSVWMINRILNTNPADSKAWLELLRTVCDHPAASDAARTESKHFLERQMARLPNDLK